MPDKTYKIGQDIFDIPETEVDAFVKDNPNAIEIESFKVDKDTFDIPVNEIEGFLKEFPQAQSLKKKVPTEFVPPFENFRKFYSEGQKDFSVVPSQSKSNAPRTTTVAGDLLRTLKSTSLRALGGISGVARLGDKTIDNFVLKPILKSIEPNASDDDIQSALDVMALSSPGGTNLEALSKYGGEAQDRLTKVANRTDAKMKQIEGGIIENFKQGNIGDGFEQLGRGVVGTIPYLAEVALTAGAGTPTVLTAIGSTAASQQYGEIRGREDLSESQKLLNSWMYGGFEAAGELVTAGILNRTFKAVGASGKQLPKEAVDKLAIGIAKKFGLVAKEGTSEAGSEMFTQIGQNITAIMTGEDPNRSIFDGVLDAGLIALVPGAGMGAVQAAVSGRAIATQDEINKVNKSHAKQAIIIDQIEESETPAAKEALEGELARLKDEEYAIIDKNVEIAQKMTDEQRAEATKLQAAKTELQSKLDGGEITEEEIPTIEEAVKNIDKQIDDLRTTTESIKTEPAIAEKPQVEEVVQKPEEIKVEPLKTEEEIKAETLKDNDINKLIDDEDLINPGYRDKIENLNVLDNYDFRDTQIPHDITEQKFWQEKLVEKALRDNGVRYTKNPSQSTDSVYYGLEMPNGEMFKLRLSSHLKKYQSDGNVVYDEKTTPEEIIEQLIDEIPSDKILKNTDIANEYKKQLSYKNITNEPLVTEINNLISKTKVEEETKDAGREEKKDIVVAEETIPTKEQGGVDVNGLRNYGQTGLEAGKGEEVTPKSGEPYSINAFHGTTKEFENFDISKVQAKDRVLMEGVLWFSNHREGSLAFASEFGINPIVMERNITFNNPLVVNAADVVQKDLYFKLSNGKIVYDIDFIKERYINKAKQEGHDGVIFLNARDAHMSGTIYAVFDTKQIKKISTPSTEPKQIATNLGIEYKGETEGLDNYTTEVNGEIYNFTTKVGATEEEVSKVRDEIVKNATEKPSDIEATIKQLEEEGKIPPTETTEPKPEEEKKKKYKIGRRVVEESTLSDEIKEDLLERGTEYIPRGAAYTDAEANELTSIYDSVEGGLDKLASMVYNVTNGILPDTRTKLNVHIADRYSKMLSDATTTEDRLKIREKLADAFVFGQEQAKIAGQWVESQKAWRDILARDPEAIITIRRRAQSIENEKVLENFSNDVKTSKQLLDELLNTEEFKKIIEEKVSEEINKIGTKKFGATDKKKIDDFFDSLLVKNDKAFDATIGIPIAVYNGAIVTIKRAVLAGVDLVNAISQAVDYIDKWYKDNYAKGDITSPDWNKDDFSAQMREKLKPLTKKVKKVKFKIPKSAEQSIVDKIYSKMEVASKPQLRRLIQGYVAELEESGVVSEQKFKDIFAKAIGLDVLSPENEQTIRLAGQSINYARKKADRLMEKFGEYFAEVQSENPDKVKISQIEKEIEIAKAEEKKARLNARRAAQKLDDILAEESTLAQTIMKLVQAGLLTPISLVSNVVGNISFVPFRGQASVVASALDSMVSALSKAYTPLLKRIDIEKNPRLAKMLSGLPTPQRVYNNFASVRGYGRGFIRGGIEGLRGMIEGQMPEDLQKREISKGLEPIKALLSFRDQLTGREQIKFDKFFSNMLEMLPAGYMGEAMFRTLNLGDKPFRRAAENARLYEIAKLKGLTGRAREQFLLNPDAESIAEMKKAGDIAVYQQDSIISDWIKNLDSYLKRQGADSRGKEISAIAKTIMFLLRTTTAPYIKTPINLAMEAIEYSTPIYSLGRAIEKMTKGDRRGTLNYMGKTIVGLEIMAIATWLIKEGLITPPPDEDEKVRQAQYEGRGAYMINLTALNRRLSGGSNQWQEGDRLWSIQRFGVLSMILMGISKAYEDTPVKEMDEMNMLQRNIAMMPSVLAGSLDQAFLSGTSTALQAILEGGPAMDKWLVSSSRALSATLYPNVLGQVSQTFFDDNYIKEVRDMYDEEKALGRQIKNTFKDRMFMGKDLPNKISIWGEPVLRVPEGRNWPYMLFDTRKEIKYQKSSFGAKMWEFYDRYRFVDEDRAKDILPSPPNAKSEVGWDNRNMTPREVEQLLMNVGRRRKSYVEHFMNSTEYESMSEEERIDELQKIYRESSSQVKAQMFMLNQLERGYPELWKIMYANDIIPIPTKTVSFKIGGEDIKLKEEGAAEYYDIVQRYFGEAASGIVDSFEGKELGDREREILKDKLNRMWQKAKDNAEKIYYKNLKTE